MFAISPLVMLNLLQPNALPLFILKQIQDDEMVFGGSK